MIAIRIVTLVAFIASVQAFHGPKAVVRQPTRVGATTKIEYNTKVESLMTMMSKAEDILAEVKSSVLQLRQIEMEDPHIADNGDGALRLAVAEAKAACDTHGPHSAEAELAFWDVDNAVDHDNFPATLHPSSRYSAAALQTHHSYNAVLDPQLLQNSIDAIEQLEALHHFAKVESKRLNDKNVSP